MKKKIIGMGVALAMLCILPNNSYAVHGTGVGNGGNSTRDAYLAQLKRELSVTDTQSSDQLIGWCSKVSAILIREKQRAMLQYQYGNKDAAEQILIDALVSAAQSLAADPQNGGPMTKKLIDRALLDSEALDQSLPSSSGLAATTKLNFLFGDISFIVDVSRDLDPTYYIPYHYNYGGCYQSCPPAFNFPDFEAAFARMAASQLSFATGNLTESVPGDGGTNVYPLGDPKAFLKIAELTTKFVADDLRQNLHAPALSCAIQNLDALSQELTAYNLYGDHTIFPNDPWAVGESAQTMNQVASEVNNLNSCGGSY